ncbi:MAG: histone deacetylase family protein, partial [Alphaproteobacteria bacterium]|nr:histone deacetylase family protein [Alphaproteobacteria bacterium]
MRTVYAPEHRLQDGKSELIDGKLVPCFECPARAEIVLECVRAANLGALVPPSSHGAAPIAAVHTEHYLRFLESAYGAWRKAHGECDALPLNWPTRGMRQREPEAIDGKLSYFSFDAGTPITAGTWRAATLAAEVALSAGDAVAAGERAAFALCRPPGHHAAADLYGGYCFLNNAAIVAQDFVARGARRVAVLDVDYHHGNGTQSIFYGRSDVLFLSLHADPRHEFPYFLGYA